MLPVGTRVQTFGIKGSPKSIDFLVQNRSILDPFWRSEKETFGESFILKVWTRVPTGSTFPKPITIRNGKRVEIKELPSTLEKVFEDEE